MQRMGRIAILGSAVMLALAACGDKDAAATGDGATTAAATADAAPALPKRQPGLWKHGMEIVTFNVPGVPAGEVDKIKAAMEAGAANAQLCLTAEEAAKEDPTRRLTEMASNADACVFEKPSINGGVFKLAGKCTAENGQKADLSISGTATATQTETTIASKGYKPDGSVEGEIVFRATSKLAGPCTAPAATATKS